MKYFSAFLLFFACQCIACDETGSMNGKVFGKILDRDSEAVDLAIYYPNTFDGAELSAVSFVYLKNEKFFMVINPSILNVDPEVVEINPKQHNWSYIALNANALNDVEVVIRYSFPPGDSGAVSLCAPRIRHRLSKIIEDI